LLILSLKASPGGLSGSTRWNNIPNQLKNTQWLATLPDYTMTVQIGGVSPPLGAMLSQLTASAMLAGGMDRYPNNSELGAINVNYIKKTPTEQRFLNIPAAHFVRRSNSSIYLQSSEPNLGIIVEFINSSLSLTYVELNTGKRYSMIKG